jgi:hypothetical protein
MQVAQARKSLLCASKRTVSFSRIRDEIESGTLKIGEKFMEKHGKHKCNGRSDIRNCVCIPTKYGQAK